MSRAARAGARRRRATRAASPGRGAHGALRAPADLVAYDEVLRQLGHALPHVAGRPGHGHRARHVPLAQRRVAAHNLDDVAELQAHAQRKRDAQRDGVCLRLRGRRGGARRAARRAPRQPGGPACRHHRRGRSRGRGAPPRAARRRAQRRRRRGRGSPKRPQHRGAALAGRRLGTPCLGPPLFFESSRCISFMVVARRRRRRAQHNAGASHAPPAGASLPAPLTAAPLRALAPRPPSRAASPPAPPRHAPPRRRRSGTRARARHRPARAPAG